MQLIQRGLIFLDRWLKMYKNYLEFFNALVDFYGGNSIRDGQAINKFRLSPSAEGFFQQALEDRLEVENSQLDNSSATHYDRRWNSTSTITSNCSLDTLTIRDFAYISLLFIYFLVAKRFVSKKIHHSVSIRHLLHELVIDTKTLFKIILMTDITNKRVL